MVQSIEMSVSVCLSVSLSVCMFVCPLAYLKNHTSKFSIRYLWPWLGLPLTAVR